MDVLVITLSNYFLTPEFEHFNRFKEFWELKNVKISCSVADI